MLSNKERRRLYDSVGHDAFLNEEASAEEPEDVHDTHFHFSFPDFLRDFHNAGPFVEDPHFHWSFAQEEEEEEEEYVHYDHYSFDGSSFSFHFGDVDEEEYYY